jgi:peroxiredoxin
LPFAPQGEHVGAIVSLSELARHRSLAVCFYRGAVPVEESDQARAAQDDTEDVRLEGWREHEAELAVLGFDVVAISSQSAEAQAQCVLGRLPTSILFLSDKDLSLAKDLELPTAMWPEGEWVYEPLTLLVEDGCISWVFFPLEHQRFDAAIATEWARRGRYRG